MATRSDARGKREDMFPTTKKDAGKKGRGQLVWQITTSMFASPGSGEKRGKGPPINSIIGWGRGGKEGRSPQNTHRIYGAGLGGGGGKRKRFLPLYALEKKRGGKGPRSPPYSPQYNVGITKKGGKVAHELYIMH